MTERRPPQESFLALARLALLWAEKLGWRPAGPAPDGSTVKFSLAVTTYYEGCRRRLSGPVPAILLPRHTPT